MTIPMMTSRRVPPRLKPSRSFTNVKMGDIWSAFRYTLWCLVNAIFKLLHLNPISLILNRWRQLHHLNTRMALSIRPRLIDLATDFFLSDERRKRKLLSWVKSILPWVGEEVFDFTACWQDGIVLCALMESISPGACPRFNLLKPHHRVNNCRLGIQLALQFLQVTQLPLSPEEMVIADEDCEVKICHLIQLLKWKYQKQGSQPKVFCHVSHEEPLPCKCHARGTGIRAGIVGRRTKFNVLTDSVSRLDLQIEIRGPNNEYNKEKIVSIHAGATARYRDHVMAAALSSPTEEDGKMKVIDDGAGNSFLRQKSLDEDFGHLVIPFDYQCVGEGRFLVTYIPRSAGLHYITVLSQGSHIQGSPFEVKVSDWVSSWNLVPKPRVVPFDMLQAMEDRRPKDSLKPAAASDKIRRKLSHVANMSKQLTLMKRRILKKVITQNGEEIICDITPSPTLSRQSSADFSSDVSEDEKFSRKSRSAKEEISSCEKKDKQIKALKNKSSSESSQAGSSDRISVAFAKDKMAPDVDVTNSPSTQMKTVGIVSVLAAIEEVSPCDRDDNNSATTDVASEKDNRKSVSQGTGVQDKTLLPCTIDYHIMQDKNTRKPNPEIVITKQKVINTGQPTPEIVITTQDIKDDNKIGSAKGCPVPISDLFAIEDSEIRNETTIQTSQVVVSPNVPLISNTLSNFHEANAESKSKSGEKIVNTSEMNSSPRNIEQFKSKTVSPVFTANDIVGTFLESLQKDHTQMSKSLSPAFSFDEKKRLKDQIQNGSLNNLECVASNNSSKDGSTKNKKDRKKDSKVTLEKQSTLTEPICEGQSLFSNSEDDRMIKEDTQIIRSKSPLAVDETFHCNPRESFISSSLGIVSNFKESASMKEPGHKDIGSSALGAHEQTENDLHIIMNNSLAKGNPTVKGPNVRKHHFQVNNVQRESRGSMVPILDSTDCSSLDNARYQSEGSADFGIVASKNNINIAKESGELSSQSSADDINENTNSDVKLSFKCTSETDCNSPISRIVDINDDTLKQNFRPHMKCSSMEFFDYELKHKIIWSQHKSLSPERKLKKALSYPSRAESLAPITVNGEGLKTSHSRPLSDDRDKNLAPSESDVDKRNFSEENKEDNKYFVKILKSDCLKKACYYIKNGQGHNSSSSLSHSSRSISLPEQISFNDISPCDSNISCDVREISDLMLRRDQFAKNKKWNTFDGNAMSHDVEDLTTTYRNGINSKDSKGFPTGHDDDEILQVVIETQRCSPDQHEDKAMEPQVQKSFTRGITEDCSHLNESEENSPTFGQTENFKVISEQGREIFLMSPKSATSKNSDNSDWSENEDCNERGSVRQKTDTESKRFLLKGDWSPQFVDLQCHSYVGNDQMLDGQNKTSQSSSHLSHGKDLLSFLIEDKDKGKTDASDYFHHRRLGQDEADIQTESFIIPCGNTHINNTVSENVTSPQFNVFINSDMAKTKSFHPSDCDKLTTRLQEKEEGCIEDRVQRDLDEGCSKVMDETRLEGSRYIKKRRRPAHHPNSQIKENLMNDRVNYKEILENTPETIWTHQSSLSHSDLYNVKPFFSTLGLFSPAVSEIIPFNNISAFKESFTDELYGSTSHLVDVFNSCPQCEDDKMLDGTGEEFPGCLGYSRECCIIPTKLRDLNLTSQRTPDTDEQSVLLDHLFAMKSPEKDGIADIISDKDDYIEEPGNADYIEQPGLLNMEDELDNLNMCQKFTETQERTLTPTKYRTGKKSKEIYGGKDAFDRNIHDEYHRFGYKKSEMEQGGFTNQSNSNVRHDLHSKHTQNGCYDSESQMFCQYPSNVNEKRHHEGPCGLHCKFCSDQMGCVNPHVMMTGHRYKMPSTNQLHHSGLINDSISYDMTKDSISKVVPPYLKKRLSKSMNKYPGYHINQPHLANKKLNKISLKSGKSKYGFEESKGERCLNLESYVNEKVDETPHLNQYKNANVTQHTSEKKKDYFTHNKENRHHSNEEDSVELLQQVLKKDDLTHFQQLAEEQSHNQTPVQQMQMLFEKQQGHVPFLHESIESLSTSNDTQGYQRNNWHHLPQPPLQLDGQHVQDYYVHPTQQHLLKLTQELSGHQLQKQYSSKQHSPKFFQEENQLIQQQSPQHHLQQQHAMHYRRSQPEPHSQDEPERNMESIAGVFRRQSTVDTFDSGITEGSSHTSQHVTPHSEIILDSLDDQLFSFYIPRP